MPVSGTTHYAVSEVINIATALLSWAASLQGIARHTVSEVLLSHEPKHVRPVTIICMSRGFKRCFISPVNAKWLCPWMYPLSRVPGSVHIVNMTGHHRHMVTWVETSAHCDTGAQRTSPGPNLLRGDTLVMFMNYLGCGRLQLVGHKIRNSVVCI